MTVPAWHALPPAQAAARLGTDGQGLSTGEARRRREQYGRNRLPEQPPTPAWLVLLRQFRSPLIYILLIATVVTLLLREFLDTVVIVIALAVNAGIGFGQERRADQAVRALAQLVVPQARVVRDGQERLVDSRDLVPGDLVLLEPGSRVPADLRLMHVTGLRVDESLLTGESTPVTKQVEPVPAAAPLADRHSVAYTGAMVTSGRAWGLVVATGEATELGAIAGLIRGERVAETPLQQRMTRFARVIGLAVAVTAGVAFGSGLWLGGTVEEMFLTAVALAVAAVPEGLPIAVTVAMALGVRRMAQRHAIMRRLAAVETLGSVTVIGSDKTGTLTENRMTVREIWTDDGFHPVGEVPAAGSPLAWTLTAGVLTNEAEAYWTEAGIEATGDPTETALLVAAIESGLVPDELRDRHAVFADIPFEPARKYSASIRQRDGRHLVVAKGAPERILGMCSHRWTGQGPAPLDPEGVNAAAAELAARGLRVLALAGRELPEPVPTPAQVGEPTGLALFGLVGMLDPPRAGVAEAIADCRAAGIRVVMITGDHAVTARAIADTLGIAGPGDRVLTGAELAGLTDAQLRQLVPEVAVYARAAPEDKLRVVRALQERGEVVAVTGDGANDAPALRAAAVGVAMGRGGTDVAREAADVVLTDDNFVSIADAVTEGRVTFQNIRKVTFFLLSSGVALVLAILLGLWWGWPLVMLPAQLLWLNIVTSGVQDVALAFEPGDRTLRRRPPRSPREGILNGVLWWRAGLAGAVMAAGTLLMFWWEWERTGSVSQAQTVAATTMVLFQALHVGNARAVRRSVWQLSPFSNRFLLIGTVVSLAIHVAAIYLPPTQWLLRFEPVDFSAWIRMVAVAFSVIVVVEADKVLRRWRGVNRSGTG